MYYFCEAHYQAIHSPILVPDPEVGDLCSTVCNYNDGSVLSLCDSTLHSSLRSSVNTCPSFCKPSLPSDL